MKRVFVLIVMVLGIFFVFWNVAAIIFQSKGPHTWFDTREALERLHLLIEEVRDKEGSLPGIERVNKMLKTSSQDAGEQDSFGLSDDLLKELTEQVEREQLSRLWGESPVYVTNEDLPDGFGFYLAGEDGVTNSTGNDPDDINSWDQDSFRFYTQREGRHRIIRNTLVALLPTSLISFLLISWPKKADAQ